MRILIINNGTKHLISLKKLLSRNDLTILPCLDVDTQTEGFNLIILSGSSKFAVTQNPKVFVNEMYTIKYGSVPIIGICEGCEVIAYTFGGNLSLFEPKDKGIREIKLFDNKYLDIPSPIKVYEAHHWAITELGKELEGLAWSSHGYEIIKHKDKKIFGLQFHPEMLTDHLTGDEIFKKITDVIVK
jgi:GMP synthase-like glutamine amidotransferase